MVERQRRAWAEAARQALLPPHPPPGSPLARALEAQAAQGLALLGLVLCVQPLAGLFVLALALGAGGEALAVRYAGAFVVFPIVLAVGIALRAGARTGSAGRIAPRLVGVGLLVLVSVLAVAEAPFRVDGGPSLLPFIVLAGVTIVPFRPLIAIVVAGGAVALYLLVTLALPLFGVMSPPASRLVATLTTPLALASVLLVAVVAAALHRARVRGIEAELERDALLEQTRGQAEALALANRELLEAQNELVRQRHDAVLGRLVAGVAHELNNPVGAIRGAADVVGRGLEALEREIEQPSPKARRALGALRSAHASAVPASDRIRHVVRSLRSFARLDEAEEQRIDLRTGVEAAVERLAGAMEAVHLERDLAPLPLVVCRPALMNEVFFQLIGNAVEATGGRGRVRLRSRGLGDAVAVSVLDDGPGIPPAQRETIFDPGYTTKGRGVGVGLGLPIVSRIVAEHGGRIAVLDGEGGLGVEMRVELPTEPADRSPAVPVGFAVGRDGG